MRQCFCQIPWILITFRKSSIFRWLWSKGWNCRNQDTLFVANCKRISSCYFQCIVTEIQTPTTTTTSTTTWCWTTARRCFSNWTSASPTRSAMIGTTPNTCCISWPISSSQPRLWFQERSNPIGCSCVVSGLAHACSWRCGGTTSCASRMCLAGTWPVLLSMDCTPWCHYIPCTRHSLTAS